MSDWTRFLADARTIDSIFGAEVPSLNNVDLHELVLHRDGPKALLRFDLAEFPRIPPAKWVAARYNRVQLRLAAIVGNVSIEGWGTRCRLDVSIERVDGVIRMRADSHRIKISIDATALLLEAVSAYRDEG